MVEILIYLLLSLNNNIEAIQKPLAIYRVHDHNFSINKTDIFISELTHWLKIMKKKLNFLNYLLKDKNFIN